MDQKKTKVLIISIISTAAVIIGACMIYIFAASKPAAKPSDAVVNLPSDAPLSPTGEENDANQTTKPLPEETMDEQQNHTIQPLPEQSAGGQQNQTAPPSETGAGSSTVTPEGVQLVTIESIADEKIYNVRSYGAKGDGAADDTEAIRAALDAAYKAGKAVVYFPSGTYRITDTITLARNDGKILAMKGNTNTRIVGALDQDMFVVEMKYNFFVSNIRFEHQGTKGKIFDALFLVASNCSFANAEENQSSIVRFAGSNCKIEHCTFTGSNKTAYALEYSKREVAGESQISINDYIVSNVFQGTGRGILVNTTELNTRVEGLKIGGNHFSNTGSEQVTIETILHCDVYNNVMEGSRDTAVLIRSRGLAVDGLFVYNNTISAGEACIKVADTNSGVITVSNITLSDSPYGFYMISQQSQTLGIFQNRFNGMTKAGVYLWPKGSSTMVSENAFSDMSNVTAVRIISPQDGFVVVADNVLGGALTDIQTDTAAKSVVTNNR